MVWGPTRQKGVARQPTEDDTARELKVAGPHPRATVVPVAHEAPLARDAWVAIDEIPQGRLPRKGEPGKLLVRSLANCRAAVPGRSRVPRLRGSKVGPTEQWRQDHTTGVVHLMHR